MWKGRKPADGCPESRGLGGPMTEIGIIIVHGIGEQERIETLTSLAWKKGSRLEL